jgi:type II secretory pathway pseudopilin PulG
MNRIIARDKGFTLLELMLTVAILMVVLAISAYVFLDNIPTMRLRGAADQLASTLQFMKVRAVATNRHAWIYFDQSDNFYTGFVDEANFGTIDSGEYELSALDMPDDNGGVPGFNLPPSVSFGFPSGYNGSSAGPDGLVPGSGNFVSTIDNYLGFRSTAIPVINFTTNAVPAQPSVIFLTNSRDEGYAVSVHITGRVKIFKWYGGAWK